MKDYSKYYHQIRKTLGELNLEIPSTMKGFSELNSSAIKEGALSSKHKELIALGIAITVRCDGCIAFHVHDSLESGATEEEIAETIGVAILMGGGPSVVYGCEAFEALKQFQVLQ